MPSVTRFLFTCMAGVLLAAPSFAQTEEKAAAPPKYFHLDFVVKEVEGGKVLTARAYTTTLSTEKGDASSIRTGDKAPLQQGGNWTYVDVGVNIDCNSMRELQDQLAMHVSADISYAAPADAAPATLPAAPPLLRQTKWSATVMIPLKKPITIFSSDGVSTKRQMELEVTATPIR